MEKSKILFFWVIRLHFFVLRSTFKHLKKVHSLEAFSIHLFNNVADIHICDVGYPDALAINLPLN